MCLECQLSQLAVCQKSKKNDEGDRITIASGHTWGLQELIEDAEVPARGTRRGHLGGARRGARRGGIDRGRYVGFPKRFRGVLSNGIRPVTPLLFAFGAVMVWWCWNRFFTPVPLRIALTLWLACVVYLAPTLFTHRVDLPGGLAYVAYPWQATGASPVKANTGIVFTQIAPWTRVARDSLRAGELPLWNRYAACGAPLLANQQTAIFHPFTLLGLLLSLGKAFTLSAALRLYCVGFFTFIFARAHGLGTFAAVFGATAFMFCSFHIVWLLFPLGLASMMLPACLVGAHEVVTRARPAACLLLTIALVSSVLGGHPESALWVWITTAAYVAVAAAAPEVRGERLRRIGLAGAAFVSAALLSAFSWLPTLSVLRYTSRYGAMQSLAANPANHGLSYEWLLPLVTPNVLGTPVKGTYTPPRGSHPAVLNDYGEVASGYAGLSALCLALAAPFTLRRHRALLFALGLMLFALLTIAEVPLWRDLLRAIPLVGISLHQRLRLLWALGICFAAAITLDGIEGGESCRPTVVMLTAGAFAVVVIYALRRPAFLLTSKLALAQALLPIITAGALALLLLLRVRRPLVAVVLVFLDLVVATYKYNPTAMPQDVYPATGAITLLQRGTSPYRFAAAGWSFLPDTPSFYGLEDIKTTDPIQHARFMRLLKGYLRIPPDAYDLLIQDYSQPFFDYLNIRYIFVPPDQSVEEARFTLRYGGADGSVYENERALPRYFLVRECTIEPDFEQTIPKLKQITDYRQAAVVDGIPARVRKLGLDAGGGSILLTQGDVRVRRYTGDATELDVHNASWALLVTSDVHWPGWRAYVNGVRLPVVTVNGAFVGCFVPPGGGRVILRYRPTEFDTGSKLAAAGFVVTALFLGVWKRRITNGKSGGSSAAEPQRA